MSNLPEPPTPIVGRERELAAATDLMRDHDVRVVTLLGPGGTGKTRLSIELATRLSEDYGGGAFFCPVATITDREDALFAIAQTLGAREQPGERVLDTLKDHLRDKHVLLVLDNTEQVLEVAPALAELLAEVPRLKMIVTSREALKIRGERVYPVPPLDRNDAVDLFATRARAADPGFELSEATTPTVEWICRRLDGLPLAIELAAARAKLFAPNEIRERLERSLLETTGEGARDLPERHQTLRAAVEWSHSMLGSAEASLFARLGVFAGGFELDAVEAVCEDTGEVISALESLVDKSLVRRDRQVEERARFAMLESIREFALEQLALAAEMEAVHRKHAQYFLAMAEFGESELRGPRQLSWVLRLGREHENFRAALRWAREHDGELGVRLAFALARFWEQRGTLAEARTWLGSALESDGRVEPAVHARGMSYLGRLALLQGDYASARAALERALAAGREMDDREEIAACVLELGWVELVTGQYGRARELLEEGLDVSRALGDEQARSRALRSLSRVFAEQGEIAAAMPLAEESLAIRRRLQDRRSIANSLSVLGRAALISGDLERARSNLEESIVIARELDDKLRLAEPLYFLALVAAEEGNRDEADALIEERLSLCRELGDRLGMAECLDLMARSNREAELVGAADAIRSQLNARIWPFESERRKALEASLRAELGDEEYEAALARGAALSVERALEMVA